MQIQVGQGEIDAQPLVVLAQSAVAGLLQSEDALHDPKRMLHLRPHSGLHKLWRPKATEAIAALANLFEANPGNQGNPVYQRLSRQIDEFGTEFLQGMALEKF